MLSFDDGCRSCNPHVFRMPLGRVPQEPRSIADVALTHQTKPELRKERLAEGAAPPPAKPALGRLRFGLEHRFDDRRFLVVLELETAEDTAYSTSDDVEHRSRIPSEFSDEKPHCQAEHSNDTQERSHGMGTMLGTGHRRSVFVAIAAVAALVFPAGAVGAEDPPPVPTIVFEGGGFGHGIGMSQYGARAQALAGRTANEITGFYYVGTEVVDAAELPIPEAEFNQPIWVGLEQNRTSATLSWPGATGTVCIDPDPSSETESCWRTVNVRVDEQIRFEWNAAAEQCTLTRIEANGTEVALAKTAPQCRASATVDGGEAIWYGDFGYAGESIELRRVPGSEAFHVIAVIDLETYVAGLDEMPTSWPQAAQEAQVLAGRSFALNRYLHFENPELRVPGDAGLWESQQVNCWCHVYDTTASQVYEGIAATTPERIAAAAATEGRVIAYLGADAAAYTRSNVIEALYSSSTGGRTLSNTDAFGSTKQYPYLIAIDDPWSIDPTAQNPYAEWTLERSTDLIADRLGWDTVRGAWLVGTDPAVVRFEGIDNGGIVVVDKKGDGLRGAANLLSGQVSEIRLEGVPTCNGYFATMWGTAAADTLVGTAGHDVIVGKGGNDLIKGRGGHDVLCGQGGADTIKGNAGSDLIVGGAGNDDLSGGAGSDTILAGPGADTADGGSKADTIDGGKGADVLVGGGGNDSIRGGGQGDHIAGDAGADELIGNAGNDHLDGGDGNGDDCRGGGGTDTATETCEIVSTVP